jgi:hypothetical protein
MLLSASIDGRANAQDVKTFPGISCQTQTNADMISRNERGQFMMNAGATTQLWFCPIVRDNPVNPLTWAQLVSTRDVSCTLFSRAQTGQLIEGEAGTPATDPTTGLVVWTWYGGNVPSAQYRGYYVFKCVVPAGDQIFSYVISESEAYR